MSDVGDLAANPGLAGGVPAVAGKPRPYVLTINGGSSSLKFAVYPAVGPSNPILSGRVERIGRGGARLVVSGIGGPGRESHAVEAPDQAAAARLLIKHLERDPGLAAIAAIGHRVVHGGVHFTEPTRVTPQMLDQLRRISPLDPEHLPGEIDLIEAFGGAVAWCAAGRLLRHRLSSHDAQDLPDRADPGASTGDSASVGMGSTGFLRLSDGGAGADRRLGGGPGTGRPAHLGSGASLAAVREGRCLETTMGFTPASGLVMGTRSGDLDPSLNAYLAKAEGMTPQQFHRMVNQESGLLGVSETSADMRDLVARA